MGCFLKKVWGAFPAVSWLLNYPLHCGLDPPHPGLDPGSPADNTNEIPARWPE